MQQIKVAVFWFMPPSTTINSHVYLDILQEKLKLFMNITNSNKFQHDGAPCHRAKLVSSWLRENGVDVIGTWPGNSSQKRSSETATLIFR